jgi:hypothetical protein
LKQVYQGNFDICGQLNIYGGVYIKEDVDISGDLNVTGPTILGIEGSEFIVNASSVFEGPALFNNTFTTVGNISTQQNIIAQQNVFIGNVLYFEGGNVFSGRGPFLYGNVERVSDLTDMYAIDDKVLFDAGTATKLTVDDEYYYLITEDNIYLTFIISNFR